MAAKLKGSAMRGNLEGRVYSTRGLTPQGKPDTKQLNEQSLRKKLPNEDISNEGVIRYNAGKVKEAYKAERKRLKKAMKDKNLEDLGEV